MINLQLSEKLLALDPPPYLVDEALVAQAASAAVDFADLEQEADLTIVLTDDDQVQELNHLYRAIDAPTDVLSFPAGDVDPDSGNLYLGDIIISLPRALAQAEAQGHSSLAELRLLVVHGVLHLLGYDHADDQEQSRMWAAQTEILSHLPEDQ